MFTRNVSLLIAVCFSLTSYAQNVGVGTTTPAAKFSVGTNSEFRVDQNGNLIRVNNVPTSFPASQGGPGQVLVNNGAGTLSWNSPTSVFGDGSGSWNVTTNLDLSLSNNPSASLPNGLNLNFNNVTINAGMTLIVPSGTVIKATGTVTILGNIIVATNSNNSIPNNGIGQAPADDYFKGIGLGVLQAAQLVKAPIQAGGGGKVDYNTLLSASSGQYGGGGGGGGLTIYAKGGITINSGGSINANGENARNSINSFSAVGPGGGGGGVIVLASQGTITNNGAIRATGGNGANGFVYNNVGQGKGGGGGGGGGVVVLISSTTPSSANINVSGGSAGSNHNPANNASIQAGGGGGACGGDGGYGGYKSISGTEATPGFGASGRTILITANNVEQYLLGR